MGIQALVRIVSQTARMTDPQRLKTYFRQPIHGVTTGKPNEGEDGTTVVVFVTTDVAVAPAEPFPFDCPPADATVDDKPVRVGRVTNSGEELWKFELFFCVPPTAPPMMAARIMMPTTTSAMMPFFVR